MKLDWIALPFALSLLLAACSQTKPLSHGGTAGFAFTVNAPNAIFGTYTGLAPASAIFSENGTPLTVENISVKSSGTTFGIGFKRTAAIIGKTVTVSVYSSGQQLLGTSQPRIIAPVDPVTPEFLGVYLYKVYANNSFIVKVYATTAPCVRLIDETGSEISRVPDSTNSSTCFNVDGLASAASGSYPAAWEKAFPNAGLSVPLADRKSYAVCASAGCTQLAPLTNISGVPLEGENLRYNPTTQILSYNFKPGMSMGACATFLDTANNYIFLTTPNSAYNCFAGNVSLTGYAGRDIPISQLNPFDPSARLSLCVLDNRGINYLICSPPMVPTTP